MTAKWNKRLAKDGHALLDYRSGWTFRGKAKDKNSGPTFVSFNQKRRDNNYPISGGSKAHLHTYDNTERFEQEAIASTVWELPVAQWFRDLTHAVTQWGWTLLKKHERFLLAYCELGFMGKAARVAGIDRFTAAKVLAKFCEDYKLSPPPDFGALQPRGTPAITDPELCQTCVLCVRPHSPHGPARG